MANREHYQWLMLAIASGNCRKWNYWRLDHPAVLPNLIAIELGEIRLPHINLSRADLSYGNFSGSDLYRANLQRANLSGANLSGTHLREADLSGACLRHANLKNADLFGANLCGADLTDARLADADLTGANMANVTIGKGAIDAAVQRGTGVSLLERAALRLLKPRVRGRFRFPAASRSALNID
jgi:uncharacterized protein YjbI with pentapeptide repeats